MPYSEDLRKKVMEYVSAVYTQHEVSRIFNLSKGTVGNWVKLLKIDGSLQVKKKKPYAARKLPSEEVIKFIKEHLDAYLREIAAHFKCAISAVFKKLKNLGISYKKNSIVQRKKRKSSPGISGRN